MMARTAMLLLAEDLTKKADVFDAERRTRRPWVRSLALLAGGRLALLPAAKCPVCIASYAGLLSSVGLGFLHDDRVVTPIIGAFLAIGLVAIAWSARGHWRLGPLLVTVVGSAAVVVGRVIWSVPAVLYGGVAFLVGASLWNLWLKRPRPDQPLIQLRLEWKEGTSP